MGVENLTAYFNQRASLAIVDLTNQASLAQSGGELAAAEKSADQQRYAKFLTDNLPRLNEIGYIAKDGNGQTTTDVSKILAFPENDPVRIQFMEFEQNAPTFRNGNNIKLDPKAFSDLNLDSGAWIDRGHRQQHYFDRSTNDRLHALPQDIQDFVSSIKDLPTTEKLNLIKGFVDGQMTYKTDSELRGEGSEFYATLEETVASKWQGDCDDYAEAYSELARLSGINPDDVQSVGGVYSYQDGTKPPDGGGHVAAMVRDGNQWYMLDMNASGVAPLNPDFTYKANDTMTVTVAPTAIYDHNSFYWTYERQRTADSPAASVSSEPVRPRDTQPASLSAAP